MALYTTQESFSFGTIRESRAVIITGSVILEAWNGAEFVADSNSPLLAGNYEVFTRGVRLRLTPAAVSSFWIDEDNQQ